MKLKQVLASALTFSDPSVCRKKAEDEKQCSSCVQSRPEKTYEHIQPTAMTVFQTVLRALYVYVCMCVGRIQVGVAHTGKTMQFSQKRPKFSKLDPAPLEQLHVCVRA